MARAKARTSSDAKTDGTAPAKASKSKAKRKTTPAKSQAKSKQIDANTTPKKRKPPTNKVKINTAKAQKVMKDKTITPKQATTPKSSKKSSKTAKNKETAPARKPVAMSVKTRAKTAPISAKSMAIRKMKKNKIKIAGLIGRGAADGDATKPKTTNKKKKTMPLREKMMERLRAARFRCLNETLYAADSQGAATLFAEDPAAFAAYHEGYRRQVRAWPTNPLATIIAAVRSMSERCVVADFGCGDAELARSVAQRVHSFDLVAANERVTACDMARVPLAGRSVDVAVFCLSLMGTNLRDFLLEANRVLRVGGLLLIAEVESRFEKVDDFVAGLRRYGFAVVHQDLGHGFFYIMHFRKERDVRNRKSLPTIALLPCIYKRR